MRCQVDNRVGFTLVEILMAAIIFVISVAGIFATLNAVRVPVANKENQLIATVFGKQVLEALRSQVNNTRFYNTTCSDRGSGECQDFSFYLGRHLVPTSALLSVGLNWPSALSTCNTSGLSYKVSCADGSGSAGQLCSQSNVALRVDLNISWPNGNGVCQ